MRAVTDYTQEVSGELESKGAKKVFTLGDLRLYECPLSYITAETSDILRLVFLMDETGVLLNEGGWGAQPYWLVEAFEIFKTERIRFFYRQE